MRWLASLAVVESGHLSGQFADFLPKRRRFQHLHPRAEAEDKVSQLDSAPNAHCQHGLAVASPTESLSWMDQA